MKERRPNYLRDLRGYQKSNDIAYEDYFTRFQFKKSDVDSKKDRKLVTSQKSQSHKLAFPYIK